MEGVGVGALDVVRIGAFEGVGWGRSRMSLSGKLHGTLCISRTHLMRGFRSRDQGLGFQV